MEEWKPQPKQEQALLADVFELLFGGARGGGKSDAGMVWLIEPEYLAHPRYRALILRKDAVDLSDWIDRAKYMYSSYGVKVIGNPPEFHFPSGAKFRLGHLKDKNSYEKYLGHEYHKILIEELTQIPEEMYYIQILGSCRSTIDLTPGIMSTTNPGGAGHVWVKHRFIDSAKPGTVWTPQDTGRTRMFLPSTIEDNKILLEKDKGYIQYLDGLKYKSEKLYKAWRLGDWDVFEGQYFSEWDEKKHVIEPFVIPSHWLRYRAVDWGFRPDPAVCLWFAVNPQGEHYCYREMVVNETLPRDFARIVNERSEGEVIEHTIADPSIFATSTSSGVSIAFQLAEGDLIVGKADNRRVDGWLRVREYLNTKKGEPKLKFFNTCMKTVKTFPGLMHDDRHPEDVAPGKWDHGQDCTRYHLMTSFGAPEEIKEKLPEEQEWVRQDFEDAVNLTKEYIDPVLGTNY